MGLPVNVVESAIRENTPRTFDVLLEDNHLINCHGYLKRFTSRIAHGCVELNSCQATVRGVIADIK